MELNNDFRVSVPVERAWSVLTDVERIAPCLPGAELQEIEGEEYRGIVKVKVGPITAQYKGKATFVEKDDSAHRAVLRAEGRDTRGQGNANATITATLTPEGSGTAVSVVTDLTVTGRVAQFGRGVLADVSAKLLDQFVACLERDLLTDDDAAAGDVGGQEPEESQPEPEREPAWSSAAAAPAAAEEVTPAAASSNGSASATTTASTGTTATTAPTSASPSEGARKIESKPAQPVDLLDAAGVPVAKRAIPAVAAVLLLLWFWRRRKR